MKSRDSAFHAIKNRIEKSSRLALVSAAFILTAMTTPSVARGHAEAGVPVITIHARRYEFIPSEITVKVGQRTKLTFISDDVSHGISVEGLLSDVDIQKGKPKGVEITPPSVGDFQGQCSWYCGVGHDKMKFLIHVAN